MKKYYYLCRIMLRTFAFGLISVLLYQNYFHITEEMKVNLPITQSESPIIVMPEDKIPWWQGSGGDGGINQEEKGERRPPELKEEYKKHQKSKK